MKTYTNLVRKTDEKIGLFHKELITLNDDLADHPEVGGQEYRTSEKMVTLLREKGFTVTYPFAGLETAYKAVFGNNNHKYKIALMAEYDALPGLGHACGHCLSGSISLLAGIALSDLQDELNADIHIIGTPDEEYDGAKPKMIRAGAFDDYDMAMMIHLYDRNQVYTKLRALDTYTYYFHGKAAHASAAPWDGHNAFNACQLFFHAVDMLRQHVKPDIQMHGIIRNPGEAPNIVPEEVSAEFYIRGFNRPYLNQVIKMLDDCAKGAAIATQTTWEKKATAEFFDDMLALPFGNALLEEAYEEMGIPLNGNVEEVFGSSDAGNVSYVCPTFHSTLKIVDEGVPIHTREFAEAVKSERAHKALADGAGIICRHVIKMLIDEENIKKLKTEFKEKKA
ncbi:M20 family metallopeptidase [Anaerovoracaceae bacterium 42-11]